MDLGQFVVEFVDIDDGGSYHLSRLKLINVEVRGSFFLVFPLPCMLSRHHVTMLVELVLDTNSVDLSYQVINCGVSKSE